MKIKRGSTKYNVWHIDYLKRVIEKNLNRPIIFKTINIGKEKFICPLCNYHGPFKDYKDEIFFIKHQNCPKYRAAYRLRLQYLVLNQILETFDSSKMAILHCAPEPILRKHLRRLFKEYISTDLIRKDTNFKADLRNLPVKDEKLFSKVDIYKSNDFRDIYQTYIYEDRSNWPKTMPLRPVMDGHKHIDIVPVCYV